MPTIAEIREKYPQYSDMSDDDLAGALHRKFYSDMPRDEFNKKIGYQVAQPEDTTASDLLSPITDIPKEVAGAFKENLDTVADATLGQAQRRRELADRPQQPGFFDLEDIKRQVGETLNVGKALAAIPGMVAAPITGATRSLIGHPYAVLSGMPYEEAKDKVDTAMMALGPRKASPIGMRSTPATVPTAQAIHDAADVGFDIAQQSNAAVKADAIKGVAQRVASELQKKGIRKGRFAPETHGLLEDIQNSGGTIATIADIKAIREELGQAAGSMDGREKMAAVTAKKAIDDYLGNIPTSDIVSGSPAEIAKTLKDAIGNYAAAKRAEDFNFRGQKAQNNAEAANSGMNLENQLRSQVRQILNNKKLQGQYSAKELEAFRAFNRGSQSANVVRYVGNALGGGGGWGTLAVGTLAHALGGPVAAVTVPAIGAITKTAGNMRAARQFDKLEQALRSRSPLAQSMPPLIAGPPNPALSVLPAFQMQNVFGVSPFAGSVPAYADEDQKRMRR